MNYYVVFNRKLETCHMRFFDKVVSTEDTYTLSKLFYFASSIILDPFASKDNVVKLSHPAEKC